MYLYNAKPLDWDVLWVCDVDPVASEVWNLLVEGLLEQWNTVGEGGNGTGTGSTPEDHVEAV